MNKAVLAFEHSSGFAGGQAVFLQILKEFQLRNFEVGAVVPHLGELRWRLEAKAFSEVETFTYREVELNAGRKSFGDYLSFCFSWGRLIRSWASFKKYDIFYVNGGRILLAAVIPALLFGKKVIYHSHVCHSRVEKLFLVALIKSGILQTVVVPSDFVRLDLQRYSRIFADRDRVVLIENCLGELFCSLPFADRFSHDSGQIRDIAVFGKVARHKGHDIIVELARDYPLLNFYFVGGRFHGDETFYEALTESAPNNVVFWGEVDSIWEFIANHQIQVSIVPSRWSEPFGLVAIESMACSCLTISSGRGGLEQIAKNTGMLCFDLDEKNSLTRLVDDLLREKQTALARLACEQYMRTQRMYSQEVFSDKLFKLVKDL